ncbi:MAG: universal stress protein [Desulfobacula sp.]|jgi:nucleotide-binding universal stress UspA family protein|uniref:universal stress protein n=1 Tax=Desulfobacula sp. TaxID=2593537 RepID=UPI001DD143C4|nr:universal stress protein [Desulfobacula sp.]MBT3485010.1 universal stress protein [Desulfobacula sp.]MBT3804173.1 universal stress protein [Desulfobacula sp.]MBT4025029.1 universal stress protein [Desulfobacula sp.]MBT4198661.1 universal stress protein [Desulfobacula sp.]
MVEPTKNILFASDLSVNMRQVFEHAAFLAVCQNANIIVIHVMEENPRSEKRIQMAFGEQLYKNLRSEQRSKARDILIGKNVDALKIRHAIAGFFEETGQDNEVFENNSLISKILVAESRSIADELTSTVKEENCDLIVMGCKQQGLLAEAMGDNIVRKVLKRSSVPVFVVPFQGES